MEIELTRNTKLSVIYDAISGGKKCTLTIVEIKVPSGDFWDKIKHFHKSEFACKCGGRYCNGFPEEPSEKLVEALDTVREYAGRPVIISSGVRCSKHNTNVGGDANSYHKKGRASDFAISGYSAQTTINIVNTLGIKPKELYAIDDSYVHIAI